MRKLNLLELEDIANGACILGSGGGGSITMKDPLLEILKAEGSVAMTPLDEIGDDDWVAVSAGAGSPDAAADADEVTRQLARATSQALEALEIRIQNKVHYTVAVETGVANTLLAMTAAANAGVPVIDGAGARRSVPSLTMCSFADVPISPMEIASTAGKVVTVGVPTASDAEEPMMAIVGTNEFDNLGGLGFWPMQGSVAKKHTAQHTVSYTEKLGQVLRQARTSGQDPVEAVRAYLDGYILIQGTISSVQSQTSGSFDYQTVTLEDESKNRISLFVQNESLIAWSSFKPYPVAMGPDLICYLTQDGQVFSNADLAPLQERGEKVAVIGAPAPEEMRKPEIVRSFIQALRSLGYGGPYVPIEFLQTLGAPMQYLRPAASHQPADFWWRSKIAKR